MDDKVVLATVRSLEGRMAVAARAVADALETDEDRIQRHLDTLIETGLLRSSILRCRVNEGYEFTTRRHWYHTPASEVTNRFGLVFCSGFQPVDDAREVVAGSGDPVGTTTVGQPAREQRVGTAALAG